MDGRADARRADAERVAERAEDAVEARIGGEKGGKLGIGEEVAKLRGAGGCFGHEAQQPCLAAWQGMRAGWPQPVRARPAGAIWGDGGMGEAGGIAAQPRPDEDDQRTGEAESDAAGDDLAHSLDDEGEAVGQGGRSGPRHEQK
ncbi:MAG TPA: hypothetical protein VFN77_02410 [Acetobacteraceae bacterium]|nr:hypothetical protein [Acetobacteraceae bacterium]